MSAIKIETVVEKDGELNLKDLPCRKGDRVEVALSFSASTPDDRERARQEFLALARASKFRSTGPYPTRDELYDRS